ncbi:PRMT5-domain-containing protein [Cylindrobasidium torrendii FP15055 ss-10]|uniref:Protein arginine N-methyltransferase n=1 Tax=Cylindrobasidium torrendii FP15055 ss-10 TaxID=1314674 RepID=A0A0D7BQD3_9AGAR|nr:PRMT5-domain-containing protein [Cylindrobasidium torrendii FP15055 ss-10]
MSRLGIALLPTNYTTTLPEGSAYDSLCLQITTEHWCERWRDMCIGSDSPKDSGSRAKTEATAERWRASQVYELGELNDTEHLAPENTILLVSPWLELDAPDAWVRHDTVVAFRQELAYASYLSMHTAIVPAPQANNRTQAAAFARALHSALLSFPGLHLAVRVPIYYYPTHDFHQPWQTWDLLRSMCEYHPRLSVALDLSPLPATLPSLIDAWNAEPVSHVVLPASLFISNAKGYPVLSKSTQGVVRNLIVHQPSVTFVLSGTDTNLHSKGGDKAYPQYIQHLHRTTAAKEGSMEYWARGYGDLLQAPLQPLMDNLQNTTYETFEQDPVKYAHYEEAIYRALMDRKERERLVLLVAGAGRGPLVKRALTALGRSKTLNAKVYVVEKNPNAWIGLQRTFKDEDRVQLLFGDMREAAIPEQVDIVISELLGSFGDNELSPECLDGVEKCLKPDGISIPCSYTAHITPLSSARLWQEARDRGGKGEEPYVVMFQSTRRLSPYVHECWEFAHPRLTPLGCDNGHNVRSAETVFNIPYGGILHGFAGYFEAVLYDTIGLSIHPERKDQVSKDMLSWFPMYIPIREPLYLPAGCELHTSIWRLTDGKKVWYEWCAEAFLDVGGSPVFSSVKSFGSSSTLGVPSSPALMTHPPPSPLIDAIEMKSPFDRNSQQFQHIGKLKIGQTGLHNPSGRSSWIGL